MANQKPKPEQKTTTEQHESMSPHPTPSVSRNVVTFLAILGILLALWLIVKLRPIVVLVLISTVFAAGLAPVVAWLERLRFFRGRRKMPRGLAIVLVYIAGLALVLTAGIVVIVPVVNASLDFSKHLPEYLDNVKGWLEGMHHRFAYVPDYAGVVDKAKRQFDAVGSYALGSVPAVFGFFGSAIALLSVAVMTFYMLLTYEGLRSSFLSLFPPKHVDKVSHTLSHMSAAMGGWLRGQITLAIIIGVLVSTGMWILQVPYFAVIGVVGAIGEVIPMVGPVAAAVPAILIVIFSPMVKWQLPAILVFFFILTQTENNFLAPKIMQKHVGLSPLTTIIALLSGATLLGIVGALLAIPIAAALQVLVKEVVVPAIRNGAGRKKW